MTSTATRPPGPTPSEPSADGPPVPLSPTSLVAAGLAVPGLDLRTARAVVDARAGRRVRFRRGVLGGCAALVLVAGLVLAVDTDEPNDVIADGDEAPSSIVTSTTAAVAETVPVPAATVPATTVAPTSTVKAPVLTVPPTIATTTVPPNQPMSVTLNVVTPSVEAGQTAEVQVLWSDPDIADPLGVRTTSVWGDPARHLPGQRGGPTAVSGPRPAGFRDHSVELPVCDASSAPGTLHGFDPGLLVRRRGRVCRGPDPHRRDHRERTRRRPGVVVLKAPPGVPSLDAATSRSYPRVRFADDGVDRSEAWVRSAPIPRRAPVTMVLRADGIQGPDRRGCRRILLLGTGPRGQPERDRDCRADQACAAATAPVAP